MVQVAQGLGRAHAVVADEYNWPVGTNFGGAARHLGQWNQEATRNLAVGKLQFFAHINELNVFARREASVQGGGGKVGQHGAKVPPAATLRDFSTPLMLLDLAQLPAEILAAVRTTGPLETAAVVTGAACVWLAARSNIWNFPVAIVSCGLYILVFTRQRLYSDAGLQVAFIALAAYGWWAWLRRQRPATPGPHPAAPEAAAPTLPITRTPPGLWGGLAAAGVAYALGAGYLLAHHTDAALPYYDSTTTAVSLVAQYLLSRRKLENWPLWIAVDVVYVGIYWHRGLALTSLLYVVYLVLATYGYWQWWREARAYALAPAPARRGRTPH